MAEEATISVTVPIEKAFKWTKRMLFDPFDLNKWLALGFCAFLASLGRGGGGGNFGNPFSQHRGPGGPGTDQVLDWIDAHLALLLAIFFGVILIAIALGALLQWLSSRGQFMFLDGVVRNRALVKEPWRVFRDLGNNLFIFRFLLGLAGLAALIIIAVVCWVIARPDIADRHFGTSAIIATVVGVILVLVLVLIVAVINLLLLDFVVPVMYRRGLAVIPAFKYFNEHILAGNVGSFILFYLMKILLGLAAAVIIMVGTCVTCCIAGLPYLSSVFFLPIFVFFQSYNLYFLGQFGKEWQFLPEVIPVAQAPAPAAEMAPASPAPPGAAPSAPVPEEKPEPPRLVWNEPQGEEPTKDPPPPPPPIE